MFELRRLRMLHEVALRGTLAAAAEALNYSPSGISQQLAVLEREAGVALLVPDGRRVRLTEAGRLLAAHAADALEADERVRGRLEDLAPASPPVRMAVMQTAARSLLPAMLTELDRSGSDVRVEVVEVPPEEGLFELSARRFDLVLAEQYPGWAREERADLDRKPLGHDAIRLAVPPDETATSLAVLAAHDWVMEPQGTAARRWAVQQCRAAGFEPIVRFEIADLAAQVRLIAAGHAVGLVPDLVWTDRTPPVRLVAADQSWTRELFTAARRATARRAGILAVREALQRAFTGRVAAS